MAQLLTPKFSPNFRKQYKKLAPSIRKKFVKQLSFIVQNRKHPSLRSKKMQGNELFEARLDYHNRFIYKVVEKQIWFYAIGPHDTGLGKK